MSRRSTSRWLLAAGLALAVLALALFIFGAGAWAKLNWLQTAETPHENELLGAIAAAAGHLALVVAAVAAAVLTFRQIRDTYRTDKATFCKDLYLELYRDPRKPQATG